LLVGSARILFDPELILFFAAAVELLGLLLSVLPDLLPALRRLPRIWVYRPADFPLVSDQPYTGDKSFPRPAVVVFRFGLSGIQTRTKPLKIK
jgi:hypothetical protein